jgi:hypothetical protein
MKRCSILKLHTIQVIFYGFVLSAVSTLFLGSQVVLSQEVSPTEAPLKNSIMQHRIGEEGSRDIHIISEPSDDWEVPTV